MRGVALIVASLFAASETGAGAYRDEPSLEIKTPLREEFQKLYVRIDAAIASGDAKQLAVVALPNAEMRGRTGEDRRPFSAFITEYKTALPKESRIVCRSTVQDVQLSGDTAVVHAKTEFAVVPESGRPARVFYNLDTWTRTADGWKLKEKTHLSSRFTAPKTDPAAARAVAAELKLRAAALATVRPGGETDDLSAFGKAAGDARIVALGEASHGTREFFQMKHRLLEYLVNEAGFTVFAIEANWPEALAVDRYIKTGEGGVETSMPQIHPSIWRTEEVRDMIEWMRAFNQAPGDHPTLTFTAFDMQIPQLAAQQALDFLKKYSPAEAPEAEAAYGDVSRIDLASESDVRAKGASEQAVAVLKVFDSKRAAMEKASSPAAWRDARQAASVAYQACAMRIPGNGAGYRDEMMAKNVEWLADQVFPNEKLVLWAHNNHVRFGGDFGHKSMGAWLRNRFGPKMYVAGFAFRGGQLRAIGTDGDQLTGLAVHNAPPAPEGFGDAILSASGMPLFFLDISRVPAKSALGRWLAESHLYYNAGAGWKTYDAEENLYPRKLSREFDGLIFVEVSHAASGLH